MAGRLAALFLIAGRFVDFFVAPRLAVLSFFPERLADERFETLRLLAVLPPDFLRDFLARAAMTLLLGVGDDDQRVRIAGTERIGKSAVVAVGLAGTRGRVVAR